MFTADRLFPGDSELSRLLQAHDWSATPLGPPEHWPQALKTCVHILLTSRQPMWLGWGPELTYLYNDAYKSIIGGKHPWALGRPTSEVWREIWTDIGPRIETTMRGEEGTYDEALLLIMERHGYPEETYYTFSYSPIPDDHGGVGGLFCANTDDTQRIISERQLELLRELAAQTLDARTVNSTCWQSARALETDPRDLPFALLYLFESNPQGGRRAVLTGASNIPRGHPAAPEFVVLDDDTPGTPAADGTVALWPLAELARAGDACVIDGLDGLDLSVPSGAWDRAPGRAIALPLAPSADAGPAGVLIVGLSPYRVLDDAYRSFLGLAAGQIAAAIGNARAYEDERRRVEALAELDRAKTVFFSNVSHEFRTPLTLLLGPVEDLLAGSRGQLLPAQRDELELAHRNGLRLLRLVNTLLDFSRLESGRVQAVFEPIDLAELTSELANTFRSTINRAGLSLVVDCPPLPDDHPVYVDPEMWENIVLNLLSNALKFTFEGHIRVALRPDDNHASVVLTVSDTGTGIPADELPRLFERFHRVEGAHARTHEGTGIGLALVQELVRLHGGVVRVASEVGNGTTFSVAIPTGNAHLPAERIDLDGRIPSAALGAAPFVEEAERWLPGGPAADTPDLVRNEVESLASLGLRPQPSPQVRTGARPHVLIVDDSADMRAYLARLLGDTYDLQLVADGLSALAAARQRRPDLVLSDVMMPGLDGFSLLQALREDAALRDVPIIMLSARAGEEATVEGISAGADDYLVKPFSARELFARIATHLELSRVRSAATEHERAARAEAEALAVENARLMRSAQEQLEIHVQLNEALRESAVARDRALAEADAARQHLHNLFMQAPAVIAVLRGPEHVFELANATFLEAIGARGGTDVIGQPLRAVLPELEQQGYLALFDRVYATGEPYFGSERAVRLNRSGGGRIDERIYNFVCQPAQDSAGRVQGILIHAIDVTGQVRAREALERRERQFATLVEASPDVIARVDESYRYVYISPNIESVTGRPPDYYIGKNHLALGISGDAAQAWEQAVQRVFRTAQPESVEYTYATEIGPRFYQSRLIPERDFTGAVRMVMAVTSDLTLRKQAEDWSRFLAEAGEVLAMSLDLDTTLQQVAQLAVPTLADWCALELLMEDETSRTAALAHVDPAKVQWAWELQTRYPADPNATTGVPQVLRTGQSELYPVLPMQLLEAGARDEEHLRIIRELGMTSAMVVPLSVGERVLGTVTFIGAESRRHYTTDDLAKAEDLARRAALAVENARLYETEKRARELAELLERQKDEFLGAAAHDLKTPLTSVRGMVQLLRRRLSRNTSVPPERLVDSLQQIDAAVTRMSALIDELLDISRHQGVGAIPLRRDTVDLVELTQTLVAEYAQISAKHKLELTVQQQPLIGDWDASRLERVLGNLLGNAIKYSPDGGEVHLTIGKNADTAIVSITDEGIGIPPAELTRIFERFHRADNVPARITGTGIGLAYVRDVVTQHGGDVTVTSTPGAGSTFVVQLPLSTPHTDSAAAL